MRRLQWLLAPLIIFVCQPALASEPTADCVIRDFQSDLTLQVENRLDITETLTVDCGNLPDKHGIFRILPTKARIQHSSDYPNMPISLASITDETGQAYRYETITSRADQTLTWKIGDPDITISGVKTYIIKYNVENVIRLDGSGLEELYWNLSGNFWQLPIDKFSATIHFPEGLYQTNLNPTVYVGKVGATTSDLNAAHFGDSQTLIISHSSTLQPYEGITLQVVQLPSGIINRYQPSFFQRYGQYLWYLLIPIVFAFCYRIWSRYGRDPKLHKAQVVEYTPPQDLKPLELGVVDKVGSLKPEYVTATIIDLAVRSYLKIEQLDKTGLFGKPDWQLTLLKKDDRLVDYEEVILDELFGGSADSSTQPTTKLSDHRNEFYVKLPIIDEMVGRRLKAQGLLDDSWKNWAGLLFVMAAATMGLLFYGGFNGWYSVHGIVSLAICLAIFIIFALLLPRHSPKGGELDYHLEGFKEYLAKAEKYRMPFYEKEGIFEKYLPYAIAFGLTGNWIRAMKHIYGSEKAAAYVPVWYGGGHGQAFAAADFDANISSLSSAISQSISSSPSSSSGGGGFSGGGGGGGGGGSW